MTTENNVLPIPVIERPAAGATVNNKVTISGTVEGDGGGTVTVYKDLTSEALVTAPVQVDGSWSATLLKDLLIGPYPIAAMLTRDNESSMRSQPRVFKVE
ncbi:hypothetical protein EI534_21750 [Pseudomonas frederiksbergensis]|nr:hypothetical protein [Pseudomonas frederiksbergensis]